MADEFGREIVRAIAEPQAGGIVSGIILATGPNAWITLADEKGSTPIAGVVVKALDDTVTHENTSTVYIVEQGEEYTDGYPLTKGQTVSLAVDNLDKVKVYVPTSGDGVAFVGIRQ
jgi:hypothetical protein